jgi:hypothetical protein
VSVSPASERNLVVLVSYQYSLFHPPGSPPIQEASPLRIIFWESKFPPPPLFLARKPGQRQRLQNFPKELRFGSCKTRSPDSVFLCVSVELVMPPFELDDYDNIGGCAEENDILYD